MIGSGASIRTPFGEKPLRYFDFSASGRFYRDVEDELAEKVLPFMANTHTETNYTGRLMTEYYENAFRKIAAYLNASPDDALLPVGYGSTGAINRLIIVMGLRDESLWKSGKTSERPVVFRSLMEHHSNDISWRETYAETEYIELDSDGRVSPDSLEEKLERYRDRQVKLGTFSAASNVTGILNDCHALARVMHRAGGKAFFDFAAAAPYVTIDMHPPDDPEGWFDAVFISGHKFLGGPRTPGLLAANKSLFTNPAPAEPGGGTVLYTSPWDHRYLSSVEQRETGGTPPIVQSIQAGLAFDLKEAIGTERIERIEEDFLSRAFSRWLPNPGLQILGNTETKRLGVVSMIFRNLHHNLVAALMNDLYGIQVRGGCMCAGPYGHCLLGIDETTSSAIRNRLDAGFIGEKPGWVRISFSPTVSEEEFQTLLEAVDHISSEGRELEKEYLLNDRTGEWIRRG